MPIGNQGGIEGQAFVSAATNNSTLVQAGPCQLFFMSAGNVNAAARFVRFYDTAVAPTSGIFIQPEAIFIVPGNTSGAGNNFGNMPHNPVTKGMQFQVGCAFQITANIALNDQSAVSAGDVCLTIGVA